MASASADPELAVGVALVRVLGLLVLLFPGEGEAAFTEVLAEGAFAGAAGFAGAAMVELGDGWVLGLGDFGLFTLGVPAPEGMPLVEAWGLGEVLAGLGVLLADGSLDGGAGLAEVVVGVGVGVELAPADVGVGDGLGDGVGSRSGSHCWPVPLAPAAVALAVVAPAAVALAVVASAAAALAVVAVSAAEAVPAMPGPAACTATENPAAAATSTPPVASLTATARTCAKRMKGPCRCCSLLLRNDYSVWSGYIRCDRPDSCGTPAVAYHTAPGATVTSTH